MHKKVKKALSCAAVAVAVAGLTFTAACTGEYYKSSALKGDYSYTEVVSNGGFAVQAGNYVYFINGIETYSATNTYGDVQKGALVRISLDDLAAGNYSSVQTVVPLIMYSGNYDGGIFIYGDYVYYSTPSTARDSDGTVLNSRIDFKRTKLDGTGTMTGYYYQSEDSALEYRFVEVDGTVYLMYVASEILYGTEAHTNIHSVNLENGTDTVLAYNVDSYVFDSSDYTNPYIYYTMSVTYNLGSNNSSTADYNQVYRVRADATESPREYDFSYVEDYDADEDPLYINLGDYVFDGRGEFSGITQFNYGYDPESGVGNDDTNTLSGYTYALASYESGVLYYTRTYYDSSDNTPILFYTTDDIVGVSDWNPVTGNPTRENNNYDGYALLLYAASISDYHFVTDSEGLPSGVIYTEAISTGYALMSAEFSDGMLINKFPMTTAGDEITLLTTSVESVDDTSYTFLYFGVTGEGNSYSVHRIALNGSEGDYTQFPRDEDSEALSNYRDTRIVDLDVAASWYMPEVLCGQFFFPSETTDMIDYEYIMVFDLRSDKSVTDNKTMSNSDIEEINDLFEEIMDEDSGVIAKIDSDTYENLQNALYYAFYTRDSGYLAEFIQKWVDAGEDEEYLFSKQSAQKYLDFCNAEGDYSDYAAYSREVNGETVYATSRDYYYCIVGYLSDDDAESYIDDLRTDYLPDEPEEELTWFEGLSTGAKAGFIIGVCLGGLIIIAAAVLIPLLIKAKKRRTLPLYTKKRMKVDTTDDKDIDVYGDAEGDNTSGQDK